MDFKELLELINRFEQSPSIMNLEAQISGDSLKLSKEPQNTPHTDSTPVPVSYTHLYPADCHA